MGKGFLNHVSHDGSPNLKREHDFRLGIWHHDNYMNEEEKRNMTLEKSLGPKIALYFWGNFLAHGYENGGEKYGDEDEDGRPCDLDTRVVGTLVRFFRLQGEAYWRSGYKV
jgi:hypothetical protein